MSLNDAICHLCDTFKQHCWEKGLDHLIGKAEKVCEIVGSPEEVSQWESATAGLVCTADEDQAPDPYDRALFQLFTLASDNLYQAYDQKATIQQYERVRAAFGGLGIDVPPASAFDLSRWQ